MSDRKWLIRKKGPVIDLLGPLPKSELKRLIKEKKLCDEDEVCSANGYWFDLSELDLVNKYIKGDEPQPFNPISDAPTILARSMSKGETHHYGKEISDITLVEMDMKDYYQSKSLSKEGSEEDNVALVKSASKESDDSPAFPAFPAFPSQNDLEYPDAPTRLRSPIKKIPERVRFWKKLFSKKS